MLSKFKIGVHNNLCFVDKITFHPAEAEKISSLLGTLNRMVGLPKIPLPISEGVFTVVATNTGLRLYRLESPENGCDFGPDDVDDLIDLLKKSVAMHTDITTLRPGPRPIHLPPAFADVVDGKGD